MAAKFPIARWSDLAYAAAAGDGRWPEMLADFARPLGAEGAVLFNPVAAGSRHPGLIVNWGSSTLESGRRYLDHWHAFDPWNASPRLTALFGTAGALRHGHEFIDDRALEATAYYNDFCRPLGGGRILCLKVSGGTNDPAPPTHLTLIRPLRSRPFEARAAGALRAFHPYLRAAMQCHWILGRAVETRTVVAGVLDDLPQPIWLLEPDGRVLHANAAAERVLLESPDIRLSMGRLTRLGRLGESCLQADLSATHAGVTRDRRTSMTFDRSARRVHVRYTGVLEASRLRSIWPRGRVLLALSIEPADTVESELQRLSREYHLTPSEQAVLAMLVAGKSLAQIALHRKAARSTIRTHLRSLFDKTGQRRQVDLVRLATNPAHPTGQTPPAAGPAFRP